MLGTVPNALFASISKSLQKALEGNAIIFSILCVKYLRLGEGTD
jgi:hypothetical protein